MEELKILLVDDEKEFVSTLAERLEMRGMIIETAHTGEDALRLVKEFKPQIVILDFMMPGMSGLAVLERIKSVRPTTQVILLSGMGGTQIGSEGIQKGAFDYLVKPLQIEELLNSISRAAENLQKKSS